MELIKRGAVMKRWYTVRDNITGEVLEFTNRLDAEFEVQRRITRYRNGYNIKHNHVDGCNAVLIENGYLFIITNGDNL